MELLKTLEQAEVRKLAFEEIRRKKSVVLSTVNDSEPASRIVDIMDIDEGGLYFVTCKTKPFYRELMAGDSVSVTVMNEDYVQFRLVGQYRILDPSEMTRIFEKNPSLADLFPPDGTESTFDVFYIDRGKGEIFDLSGKHMKMQRARFAFGGATVSDAGCVITQACINCGDCAVKCPFGAITQDEIHVIDPNTCDECGICYAVCPVDAIELPKGL